MERLGLTPAFFSQQAVQQPNGAKTPIKAQEQFSQMLTNAMNQVNDAQINADNETEKLINNQAVNLHDVMIAAEKASVTMQVTLEVRNKAIEAYQEIMRMPL